LQNPNFEYFALQFGEGARVIRYLIERRFKMLQFIGFYHAAVLTFAVSKDIIFNVQDPMRGIPVCILSFLVALLGFATEFAGEKYSYGYFRVIQKTNKKLEKMGFNVIGISHRKSETDKQILPKLPADHACVFFYLFLIIFWVIITTLTLKSF
jgi:hypothetical protein